MREDQRRQELDTFPEQLKALKTKQAYLDQRPLLLLLFINPMSSPPSSRHQRLPGIGALLFIPFSIRKHHLVIPVLPFLIAIIQYFEHRLHIKRRARSILTRSGAQRILESRSMMVLIAVRLGLTSTRRCFLGQNVSRRRSSRRSGRRQGRKVCCMRLCGCVG